MARALSSLMIKQADPPSVCNQEEKKKNKQKLFSLLPGKSKPLVTDLVGRFIRFSLAVCQLREVITGFKVMILVLVNCQ